MKKFISKLFNILVFALLVFSIINGAYLSLNPEIQEKYFSWYNQAYATINAVWAGLGGLGGTAVIHFITKAKDEADDKYYLLRSEYREVKEGYNELKTEVLGLKDEVNQYKQEQAETNKLIKINLEAKLDNDLVDAKVKETINVALGKGDQHEKEK